MNDFTLNLLIAGIETEITGRVVYECGGDEFELSEVKEIFTFSSCILDKEDLDDFAEEHKREIWTAIKEEFKDAI